MGKSAANLFINVAERFSDEIHNYCGFAPTDLYALAAPSRPDEVVEHAVEQSKSGEIEIVFNDN